MASVSLYMALCLSNGRLTDPLCMRVILPCGSSMIKYPCCKCEGDVLH